MKLNYNIINQSYTCLIQCGINKLPVKLGKICRIFQVKVVKLNDISNHPDRLGLLGGLIKLDGNLCILIDDSDTMSSQRFVIASELGRVFTGNQLSDLDAYQFALNLLAPIPVLTALNIDSARQISMLCNMPMHAAKQQSANIQEYMNNDSSNSNESVLYSQFQDFILGKNAKY